MVATSKAIEGIGVVDGTEIVIADRPDDFARKIIQVIGDIEFRIRLQRNSINFLRKHHNPYEIEKQYLQIYDGLV